MQTTTGSTAHLLKDYDANIFMGLSEFEISQTRLKSHNKNLQTLGSVICRHDLEDVVGISLLHKHFDISQKELLVKEFVGNEAYTKPQVLTEQQTVTPYMWKLNRDEIKGGFGYYPLEFVRPSKQAKRAQETASIVVNAKQFLNEMADTMLQLDLQEIFGIATLHNDSALSVKHDEFLSETTDYENRTLRIRPEPKNESNRAKSTETLWRFTSSKDTGIPLIGCDVSCTGKVAAMHCSCGSHRPSNL